MAGFIKILGIVHSEKLKYYLIISTIKSTTVPILGYGEVTMGRVRLDMRDGRIQSRQRLAHA